MSPAHHDQRAGSPVLLRHPFGDNVLRRFRNFNLMSIIYAFRPRLRNRLTLSGLPLLEETLDLRRERFPRSFSLLNPELSLLLRPAVLTVGLQPMAERSSTKTPPRGGKPSIASVACLSPVNCRRRIARTVSYYALFKWWLLLSQHPGCLGDSTSLTT